MLEEEGVCFANDKVNNNSMAVHSVVVAIEAKITSSFSGNLPTSELVVLSDAL